jgi:hypothetical protein
MRRNPGRWRKSLAHLMRGARNVLESFYEPEFGRGKHRGGWTGGGSQRMRVSKHAACHRIQTSDGRWVFPREKKP